MTDRVDPSQYAFTAGDPDFSAFEPDTAGTPNAPQTDPEGVYAAADELNGYPDHAGPTDPLSVRPADYYTRGRTVTRETGQPFPFATSAPLYFQDGYLAGYSLRDTGNAGAVVEFRDGADPSGKLLWAAAVPAGGAAGDWFLPGGILFARGLYAQVVSGTVTGTAIVARELIL